MPKNSKTFYSRIRYAIMDEDGVWGGFEYPEFMSLPEARKLFDEHLDDLGQNAQIVKVRVTYEVLNYEEDAFTLPE